MELTNEERVMLVQHAILKYENEETLVQKLGTILDERTIQRTIDMLIGTQRVRRIGPDMLQNNQSHTEIMPPTEKISAMVQDL